MPLESLTPPMLTNASRERRRNPRVTPDPLLVIRFSSGNSGVVLDVSREGLGFLASAPVQETHSVRFEIAGRQTLTSEAIGRVMWKDSTGKRAGVKFTQLPEELRALIHRCLPAEAAPQGIQQQDNRAPRRIVDDTEDFPFEESARSFPLANPRRMVFVANGVTCALACLIVLGIWHSVYQRDAVFAPLSWRQEASRAFAFLRARTSAGVANAAQISARIFKDSTDPASSSAKAAVPVQGIASGTLPLPPALPAVFDLSALSATKNSPLRSAVSPELAAPPQNARAKESAARTNEAEHAANAIAENSGPAALTMALELLQKDARPEQQAAALRLLWQAVAKGNVAAELDLAEVYLAGQGAAKSCGQARVLLNAAVSRKSELAKQKLADLAAYGCE